MIVRLLLVSVFFSLCGASVASAAVGDKRVDVGFGVQTDPVVGMASGWGVSLGGGVDVADVSPFLKGGALQVRGDVARNSWKKQGIEYTRHPVTAGVRLYDPMAGIRGYTYGEAGVSVSFDKAVSSARFASEVNVGFTPGVGVEFEVGRAMRFGLGLRYHLIDRGYLDSSASLGFVF